MHTDITKGFAASIIKVDE